MRLRVLQEGLVSAVCAKVLVPWGQRWLQVAPIIPYYHIVTDAEVPHVKHLYTYRGEAAFKRDLDVLLGRFRAMSLEELIAHLHSHQALPRDALLLTFDDGFREMREVVAPILLAKGVPATFFVTTGCIDNHTLAHHNKLSVLLEHIVSQGGAALTKEVSRWLTRHGLPGDGLTPRLLALDYQQGHLVDELAAVCAYDFAEYLTTCQPYLTSEHVWWLLQQGFTIGSHSLDHPRYAALSMAEQLDQTRASLRWLEERFQIRYRAFAFPHSDAGVTLDFFRVLFDEGTLDVSFGTGGMLPHCFARNFQRFPMEKTLLPAESILAKQYARVLYRTLTGRGIRRD
jgi:peptidoglycan/xylan/chitin deacetylase (PgdA/CDA1 family)